MTEESETTALPDYRKLFTDYLEENGLRYNEAEGGAVRIAFAGREMKIITAFATVDNAEASARICCWDIAHVRKERRRALLDLCNALNRRLTWGKFFIDRDDAVSAKLEIAFTERNCANACLSMVRNLVQSVDEAYPLIMKVLWGEEPPAGNAPAARDASGTGEPPLVMPCGTDLIQ